MEIQLAEAIKQIRAELRSAALEGEDNNGIVFTPKEIEIELAIKFSVAAEVGGKVKLLTLLDASVGGGANKEAAHKLRISLIVSDNDGAPIKVGSNRLPLGLADGS